MARRSMILMLTALLLAAAAGARGEKAPKPDLSGAWKLNDLVTAKLMEGMRDRDRPAGGFHGGGRGGGGGGRGGGGRVGGPPGGGDPDGGGRPGGRMRGDDSSAPRMSMKDLDELSIVETDSEVTITDGGGRSRALKPNGKKVKVEGPGGKETVRTTWADGSLVVKIKPEKGQERTELWTISNDGKRLFLTLSMSGGPPRSFVRAYDRAEAEED